MNIVLIVLIIVILCWNSIYTISYGLWTIKENKKGGIALLILALVSISLPLYILWTRL